MRARGGWRGPAAGPGPEGSGAGPCSEVVPALRASGGPSGCSLPPLGVSSKQPWRWQLAEVLFFSSPGHHAGGERHEACAASHREYSSSLLLLAGRRSALLRSPVWLTCPRCHLE